MTFFYLNYCILTMCLFCLTIILSPTTIVGMGILGLVWMWFIRASSSGTVVVGSKFRSFHFCQTLLAAHVLHAFNCITIPSNPYPTENGSCCSWRFVRFLSPMDFSKCFLVDHAFFGFSGGDPCFFERRFYAQGHGRCCRDGRRSSHGRRLGIFECGLKRSLLERLSDTVMFPVCILFSYLFDRI